MLVIAAGVLLALIVFYNAGTIMRIILTLAIVALLCVLYKSLYPTSGPLGM